jgi:hypothetical protein
MKEEKKQKNYKRGSNKTGWEKDIHKFPSAVS